MSNRTPEFLATLDFAPVVVTEKQEPGAHHFSDVQGLRDALTERIVSRPPSGMSQIHNFYYDPTAERFVIVIADDSPDGLEVKTISFKVTELAQIVTILSKTLIEQEVIDEPLADDYNWEHLLLTLKDDLDAEV